MEGAKSSGKDPWSVKAVFLPATPMVRVLADAPAKNATGFHELGPSAATSSVCISSAKPPAPSNETDQVAGGPAVLVHFESNSQTRSAESRRIQRGYLLYVSCGRL